NPPEGQFESLVGFNVVLRQGQQGGLVRRRGVRVLEPREWMGNFLELRVATAEMFGACRVFKALVTQNLARRFDFIGAYRVRTSRVVGWLKLRLFGRYPIKRWNTKL